MITNRGSEKRKGAKLLWLLLCLMMLVITGCHTMQFDVAKAKHEKVVEKTNWFFVFGWFPKREVDVALLCPSGVASIKEQTTFGDGLIDLLTLSIVYPRSVWYYCLPESAPNQVSQAAATQEVSR